jgi:pimeloyl-ACP methyl ester carboxylesterase
MDPSVPEAKVHLWHGGTDRLVPIASARWLAAKYGDCEARWLEDEGHGLIHDHADEILAVVAAARD